MSADEIVAADLENICGRLKPEFSSMQRKETFHKRGSRLSRLLPHPGSAALEPRPRRTVRQFRVIACDNYIRGVPDWLASAL